MPYTFNEIDPLVLTSIAAGWLGGLLSIVVRRRHWKRVEQFASSFKVKFIEPILLSLGIGIMLGVMTFGLASFDISAFEEFTLAEMFLLDFFIASADGLFSLISRVWKSDLSI